MKNKVQPNDIEILLQEDDFIVSKTDSKGVITYVNQTFVRVSGFKEKELISKQHNIIRHPDMPRALFQRLWDTIESGNEFNGYIKNLSKDGRFYWVFANITASLDVNGNLLGYYSVRRKPKHEAVVYIEDLYLQMLQLEKEADTKDAIQASHQILDNIMQEKRLGYDEFVFTL